MVRTLDQLYEIEEEINNDLKISFLNIVEGYTSANPLNCYIPLDFEANVMNELDVPIVITMWKENNDVVMKIDDYGVNLYLSDYLIEEKTYILDKLLKQINKN